MSDAVYRVLARKYRPRRFDDLIGQDVLVRTLSNAFSSGRIAHAFLLTGIRGIGKTTTARIIARGLNCIGPDGTGAPTTSPCGECPNCKMILEDRHVDIIEMDAASRTGVDDIRDIIETVHYAPTSARYKIYIIDEVHMLTKNAFNALLKTLEEPPAHVKFIFATTELRKIPITIVSRCQRFDLRRIEMDMLADHLQRICDQEAVKTDRESLELIAAAAEGSVRDSLSLLDQAIALSSNQAGEVTLQSAEVRQMIGMADKTQLLELLEHVFNAETLAAITLLREHYQHGGDPLQLMQDLLGLLHYCTRIKVAEALADDVHFSAAERNRASTLAASLSMPSLTRGWQMLLKGIDEMRLAAQPLAAAEMILIRLSYAANLPTPDRLIKQFQGDTNQVAAAPSAQASARPAPVASTRGNLALAVQHEAIASPEPVAEAEKTPQPTCFLDVVRLFQKHKEVVLYSHLYNDVRLVSFARGMIEVLPTEHIPADFAARVSRHLSEWCGEPWRLRYGDSDAASEPSLREQEAKKRQQRMDYAQSHPHIQQIRELFGGAEILDVEPLEEDTP